MKAKRIDIEGIDKDYTFLVVVGTAEEVAEIAHRQVGATFIDYRAYFCDFSPGCIAHECLHITFQFIRETLSDYSFDSLLSDIPGEEGIAYSFSKILEEVTKAIDELRVADKEVTYA